MNPNEEEKVYDIGNNAETLGIWFLVFRYALPFIFALILAIGLGAFLLFFLHFFFAQPINLYPLATTVYS